MSHLGPATQIPCLPLLLHETPPGLALALAQEGVPFRVVADLNPLAMLAGRFVLYDGRRVRRSRLEAALSADHLALDVDVIRRDLADDPFRALVDTGAAPMVWDLDGLRLTERVARHPKAGPRRAVLGRIRRVVEATGGVWARLASFPHPYRSAFNLRLDLDEPAPEDYFRFARARGPLDDCTTHFVSTAAYGDHPEVLRDLATVDTQSHGHYHVVYRDRDANRANLERAHRILTDAGIEPTGFAGPHGRWNPGIDGVLEEMGYRYASDFALDYDDLPFFPWRGDRFSHVLQVPVHPICEGLFAEAGEPDAGAVARHLLGVVEAKIGAGEPAFVYGHPEGRLARQPEVLEALAGAIADRPLLWRVGLTGFAAWWRWRSRRNWSLVPRGDGRHEVQFDDWDARFPLAIEFHRGRHLARVPVKHPRVALRLDELAYELGPTPAEVLPAARPATDRGWRAIVREALEWETVTPLDELPTVSWPDRLKKGLRAWQAAGRAAV